MTAAMTRPGAPTGSVRCTVVGRKRCVAVPAAACGASCNGRPANIAPCVQDALDDLQQTCPETALAIRLLFRYMIKCVEKKEGSNKQRTP